jgi:glycosyltransferase involved in cell wall biosynthesis
MKCSICISTHNKAAYLHRTLGSIFRQDPPFDWEVCVCDDGSPETDTARICREYGVKYTRRDRQPGFRNQCIPRNISYRMATGDIVISQADDVVHVTDNAIERLVDELKPGTFVIANVFNTDPLGNKVLSYGITEYIGPSRKKPFFFLGSLFRNDIYRVGGNDEEFDVAPAFEDDWFGDCLIKGLGLTPVYTANVVGHHIDHPRPFVYQDTVPADMLYRRKSKLAAMGKIPYCAAGGPWT